MTESEFSDYLRSHGAREYEVVALVMDIPRAQAAMDVALERGADRPVPYALKMFDDPGWQVRKPKPVLLTNQAVNTKCAHCGGDRFVLVTDGRGLYEETYAPCAVCNGAADTAFWTVHGEQRVATPR